MRIHLRYKALDSREQRVARLLGRLFWPFTMTRLGGQLDLAPTICMYRTYFSRPETDPFSGDYEAVLYPYRIDPMNAAAAPLLRPAYCNKSTKPAIKETLPPSSCGTLRPGSPRIGTPAAYPSFTPSFTKPVGWEGRPATWKTGPSQTAATCPTAPHPWQTGTLHTFTLPRLSMCRAPPPSTCLAQATQTSRCWDPKERETRGLKSYAVARQCMSPRRMSVYCKAPI